VKKDMGGNQKRMDLWFGESVSEQPGNNFWDKVRKFSLATSYR
jgi:hypothetical protein